MQVIEKGHVYDLNNRVLGAVGVPAGQPTNPKNVLTFVNKEPGREHGGTTTQEVLRALIDRTRHCNNCLPHPVNERIVYHLRMALVLHEARALERKTEKGDIKPEHIEVGGDGHFDLKNAYERTHNMTFDLKPYRPDWERECQYPLEKTPMIVTEKTKLVYDCIVWYRGRTKQHGKRRSTLRQFKIQVQAFTAEEAILEAEHQFRLLHPRKNIGALTEAVIHVED